MIPIPVALVIAGLLMVLLGLWVSRLLMQSLGEYRPESESQSGRLAADRSAGLALCYSWLLIAAGLAALALAAYLHFRVRI